MKKTLRLFAASLAAAIIVTIIGAAVVRHHNVSTGDMYDVLTKGISIGEPVYSFTKTEKKDISGFDGLTVENYLTYQLNEFNTIELYAQYCSAEVIGGTSGDKLVVSIDYPENVRDKVGLHTAVKDGKLYIQNNWTGKPTSNYGEVEITIYIPDDYRGGYEIYADSAQITLSDTESSMGMEFNLHNCNITAENLNSTDIMIDMSGTNANIKSAVSKDGFTLSAVSSNIKIEDIEAAYSRTVMSSSALDITSIKGSLSYDSDLSKLNILCGAVTGNMNLKSSKGSVNLTLPKNAPAALRHSESWSAFRNNTGISESDEKNKDLQYIIETNVEFTIVTLEEK